MLSFWSGMTFVRSISFTVPSPLHFGQAPSGELNEKMLGAASPYEMPDTGSISRFEKLRTAPVSLSMIISAPSPCFMAVSTLCFRRWSSLSCTFSLSITTSML